jgi:hypothetical protein
MAIFLADNATLYCKGMRDLGGKTAISPHRYIAPHQSAPTHRRFAPLRRAGGLTISSDLCSVMELLMTASSLARH